MKAVHGQHQPTPTSLRRQAAHAASDAGDGAQVLAHARRGGLLPQGQLRLGRVQGAAAVASFLTEIYLCGVCSCQEILRRNVRGQDPLGLRGCVSVRRDRLPRGHSRAGAPPPTPPLRAPIPCVAEPATTGDPACVLPCPPGVCPPHSPPGDRGLRARLRWRRSSASPTATPSMASTWHRASTSRSCGSCSARASSASTCAAAFPSWKRPI
jgi:hypothetical protein